MRIAIINTDYGPFLRSLYGSNPSLADQSHHEQMRQRNHTLFGCADFYSRNLIALGHEAWEIHANNGAMQTTWLKEQGHEASAFRNDGRQNFLGRFGRFLRPGRRGGEPTRPRPSHLRSPIEPLDVDLENILVAQIESLRPDVVLNQAVSEVDSWTLNRLRPYTRMIVGQIASPLPDDESYSAYDMMISSLPNFVKYYRDLGLVAQLNRLAFEPAVLESVGSVTRDIPLSFVGSITSEHASRFQLIESLASETDIQIWGRLTSTPEQSPIWKRYHGEAWGRDMFSLLARSKITINQHIDISENYANNMRLFEATGMGALLITDWKDNIAEMFEPGKEIVCYRSSDECVDMIRYYSQHEAEREAIAAAGQRRALRDHTYRHRLQELAHLFEQRLSRPRRWVGRERLRRPAT